MTWMRRTVLRPWIEVCAAVLLGAFVSTAAHGKTATWEEEVLLNTGEVIRLHRTLGFALRGAAGNPFDISYHPTRNSTYEFTYKGKTYRYEGAGGFLVLAVSPSGVPVLVKNADSGAWYATANYQCTIPFYVQFVPDDTGRKWKWPASIEQWLYGIRANLMSAPERPRLFRSTYTLADKRRLAVNADPQQAFMHKIDPTYTGDRCRK